MVGSMSQRCNDQFLERLSRQLSSVLRYKRDLEWIPLDDLRTEFGGSIQRSSSQDIREVVQSSIGRRGHRFQLSESDRKLYIRATYAHDNEHPGHERYQGGRRYRYDSRHHGSSTARNPAATRSYNDHRRSEPCWVSSVGPQSGNYSSQMLPHVEPDAPGSTDSETEPELHRRRSRVHKQSQQVPDGRPAPAIQAISFPIASLLEGSNTRCKASVKCPPPVPPKAATSNTNTRTSPAPQAQQDQPLRKEEIMQMEEERKKNTKETPAMIASLSETAVDGLMADFAPAADRSCNSSGTIFCKASASSPAWNGQDQLSTRDGRGGPTDHMAADSNEATLQSDANPPLFMDGWHKYVDPDSRRPWYWNESTGECFYGDDAANLWWTLHLDKEGNTWWEHATSKRSFLEPGLECDE